MAYFEKFPIITYNGQRCRNIIDKAVFANNLLKQFNQFYPYQIKEGERADIIAYNYYGDSAYDWLVWFSAQIVDPYYQWPLTTEQFADFIVKKYGSFEAANEQIVYYQYNPDVDPTDIEAAYKANYKMGITTFNQLSSEEKGFWSPVIAYDMEHQKNEDNRNILLISRIYKTQIDSALSDALKK